MVSAKNPGLGVGDEFIDPGQPAVEEEKIPGHPGIDLDIFKGGDCPFVESKAQTFPIIHR